MRKALSTSLTILILIPSASAILVGPTDASLEHLAHVDHPSAAGLWVEDGTAYVSGWTTSFFVADVSDPAQPEKLATAPVEARDVGLLQGGSGPIAVLATGGSVDLVDVSDPTDPRILSSVDPADSVHNVAVLPGTDLVYVSRGGVFDDGIDIVDVSDPVDPRIVTVWNEGFSCHDVTVYPEADRAYCAAAGTTEILDIADPLEPEVIGTIQNPAIDLHHWAVPARNHSILVVGDEAFGTPNGCEAHVGTPAADVSSPTGALWFYDISDPAVPVPLSWWSAPATFETPCTAHFGEVVDDDLLAVGWYKDGVVLIDHSDPVRPRLADRWSGPEANTWDVRHEDGHLFAGNIDSGLDVLALETGS